MSSPVAFWAVGFVTGFVFGARIGWIWAKPRDRDSDWRRSINHENTNRPSGPPPLLYQPAPNLTPMTDFRALCVELTDCLEKADWPHRYKVVFQQWMDIAHAALAEPDGPAVSDDREPASVTDQLKHQLLLKVKADLIREVINQALKDTASVHWRVTDTGEQIVRVGDLLRWAEQAANNMEKTDDN